MSCKFCGKVFDCGFNLRRHEREYCSLKDRSSQEMNFENDFSSDFTDRSESLTTTDNESESAEQLDPWIPLIEEAKQRSNIAFEETKESLLNSGLDEESATKLAYSNILPKLQKELESVYMQRLMWMVQFRNDPVHRKIMQTKDAYTKNDYIDAEEATEAAIDKRLTIKQSYRGYSIILQHRSTNQSSGIGLVTL